MTLTFLPEAAAELYESAVYYQAKEAGWRSASAMNSPKSSQRFVATPHLWREQAGGYRRVNCPVFPYYVAYFIRGDLILIAAVAHAARHPDYRKQREIS